MKCLVTVLKATVNDDSLPVATIVSEETKEIMKSYSNANGDMAYYVQKFFDRIGDAKTKIIFCRCPCLSSTIIEAVKIDLIDGMSHGEQVDLGQTPYDASTRSFGKTRVQVAGLNTGNSFNSLVLNNLSCIYVKSKPSNPITLKSGIWDAIGWGKTVYPAGQYNFIDTDGTIKARYYNTGGLDYSIKSANDFLVKDANPDYFQDFSSASGAVVYMQDATVEEYERVFTALVEFVDNINNCWNNM